MLENIRSYANYNKNSRLYILVKQLLGGIDMKFQKVNIATARIKGLKKPPYYFDHHCYYAWDIKVGNTEEEGEVFCNQFKENFNEAHIYDGDKVAVIFGDDGRVLAIGNTGEDAWIDTTDKFVKKTFAELNIVITSLKVY